MIAGVPQGGVISPTLFNVHVNDIEECIPREIPVSTCTRSPSWNVQLPYSVCETAFSQVGLFLD